MDTTRTDLTRRLADLDQRYRLLMRGRMVPTPKALRVKSEILALRSDIEALDRDAAERLALSRAPVDEVLEVIALPLLADVMNDLVASVDATLRRHGVQQTVFSTYTSEISPPNALKERIFTSSPVARQQRAKEIHPSSCG